MTQRLAEMLARYHAMTEELLESELAFLRARLASLQAQDQREAAEATMNLGKSERLRLWEEIVAARVEGEWEADAGL